MKKIYLLLSLILFVSCTEKKQKTEETMTEKTNIKIQNSVMGVSILDNRQIVLDSLSKKGYDLEDDKYKITTTKGVVFSDFFFPSLEYWIGDDAKVYRICVNADFPSLKEAKDFYDKVLKDINTKYAVYKTNAHNDECIASETYEDDKTNLSVSIIHQSPLSDGVPHPEVMDEYEKQLLAEKWSVEVRYDLSKKEIEKLKKNEF